MPGYPFKNTFLGGSLGSPPPALFGAHRHTEDGTGSGPDGRVEGADRLADGAVARGTHPAVGGKHQNLS